MRLSRLLLRRAVVTSTRRVRRRLPRFRERKRPANSPSLPRRASQRSKSIRMAASTGVTYVKGGAGVLPAGRRGSRCRIRLRKRAPSAALEIEGVPERSLQQSRPGWPTLLQPQSGRSGVGALSVRSEQLVRRCRHRESASTTGRTTTSITPGLDFIGGGNMWVYTERRPIASVNGLGAWLQGKPTWGSAWKAFVKENADRTNSAYLQKTTLPYEDNYLDLDPNREGLLRRTGHSNHRRVQGQREEDRALHARKDGAVVSGRRRHRRFNGNRSRTPWDPRRTRTAARAWAAIRKRTS